MKTLREIFPPPAVPTEENRQEWAIVEQRLATRLPADYKAFIDEFGLGAIDSFIWIFSPFTRNQYVNLERELKEIGDTLAQLAQGGEEIPFAYYPNPGGLFPFGGTDNGDVLYWKTDGDPDFWPVVVNEARGPHWETYNLSMTAFLLQVFTGELVCTVFPHDFPSNSPTFTAAEDA
jgi:hypothetical protein